MARKAATGAPGPFVASSLRSLGRVLLEQGQAADAEPLLARALETLEQLN